MVLLNDVQRTVVVQQIQYIALCDATTSSRVFRNCGRTFSKCSTTVGGQCPFRDAEAFSHHLRIKLMDSPESFVKSQIACVVKNVLCELRHGRKPRSTSSHLHCLLFWCFWNIFSFLLLTFNMEKHSLFFEKNGNTTSPFFYGQKIFVCALSSFKSLLWILISVIQKTEQICTLLFSFNFCNIFLKKCLSTFFTTSLHILEKNLMFYFALLKTLSVDPQSKKKPLVFFLERSSSCVIFLDC